MSIDIQDSTDTFARRILESLLKCPAFTERFTEKSLSDTVIEENSTSENTSVDVIMTANTGIKYTNSKAKTGETSVRYMQLPPKQVSIFNDLEHLITSFTGAKFENNRVWFT